MNDEELLKNLFYKKLLFSFNELYKKAKEAHPKIKKSYVKEFFDKQQAIQQTNKPVGKKEYLPIYSETPYAFQIDLTFFPRYKKQNDGYYVLFTAININSRYAYAYSAKNKSMETILKIMHEMEKKTIINSLTMDEGSEFKNNEFKKFCIDNNIKPYYSKGDSHVLGIINRFHRTLKETLIKYFIAYNTVKWVDVIDKIINNYNHSKNRGIGIEPYKVNSFIENDIIMQKRDKTDDINNINKDFIIGDKVRIILKVNKFDDKLKPKYTNKIYEVIEIKTNSLIVVDEKNEKYKVKKSDVKFIKDIDLNNEIKALDNANYISKVDKNKLKAGVEDSNILESKRDKKPNKKYN